VSHATDPAAWLAKADNDLLTIENNVHAARVPWDVVCYHAQQVAEKVLKAYLVAHDRTPPKTHDLIVLLGQCVACGAPASDLEEDCRFLLRFAASARYPGDPFEPNRQQGMAAYEAAQRVQARFRTLIAEIGEAAKVAAPAIEKQADPPELG
jgi:HEPN domain-containing protein